MSSSIFIINIMAKFSHTARFGKGENGEQKERKILKMLILGKTFELGDHNSNSFEDSAPIFSLFDHSIPHYTQFLGGLSFSKVL